MIKKYKIEEMSKKDHFIIERDKSKIYQMKMRSFFLPDSFVMHNFFISFMRKKIVKCMYPRLFYRVLRKFRYLFN